MPGPRSIAGRLVATAAAWVVIALIAGGFLLANLFREPLEASFEQRLRFLLQSLVSAASIDAEGNIAELPALGEPRFLSQYSGLYWQIGRADTGTVLRRSRSMWDFELPVAAQPAGGTIERRYAADGPLDQRLRVVELYVTEQDAPGTYVFTVAADRDEFLFAVDAFNRMLVWSLAALGGGLLLAVLIQVYVGLRPLQRVRQAVLEVREGRAQRLLGDFPAEVQPLVEELNGLLDHTGDVLARARAHVGNLAHALKTPLSVLANEADRPAADPAVLRQQAATMRRHVDHYLTRARSVGQVGQLAQRTPLLPAIQGLARTLEKIHAAAPRAIEIECAPHLAFRGEAQDLEEMLGNLIDNACKWAAARVRVQVSADAVTGSGGLQVRVAIEDDGPGVDPGLRAELFRRGVRGDESKPGSGLGLAIVRDVAALYGGRVELSDSPLGGLRVLLVLPGAAT